MADIAEYQRLLAIGSGRAALILKDGDARPYREAILHACLHNLTYDKQCEPSREQYLFDLINLSGEPDFFRSRLLAIPPNFPDEMDGDQILAIMRLFAEQGEAEARRCLYDTFAANVATDLPDGASEIVELDGLAGLLTVAERLVIEPDDWWPDYLVGLVEEREGAEAAASALDEAASRNTQIASFVTAVRACRTRDERRAVEQRRPRDEARTYEQIQREIETNPKTSFFALVRWSRTASMIELERAATDFQREQRPEVLRAYLALFRERTFPLDYARLMELAQDGNRRVSAPAIGALKNISEPPIRSLALELLASGRGDGAELLANHYREGDYAIIERALLMWRDRDEIHYLGFDLRDLVDAHPAIDAAGALLASYERGPCSSCRYHTVKSLDRLSALPTWMIAECRHDANPDLRAAMARRERAPESAWADE